MSKGTVDNTIDIGLAAILWIGGLIVDNIDTITEVTAEGLKLATTIVVFFTAIHRYRKFRKEKKSEEDGTN